LHRVLEIAADVLDGDRIAVARRRQADMLGWRDSDYIPVVYGGRCEELADAPDFDWAEQFADPSASLYMQLKDVVIAASGDGDYVPTVRADTGVVNGPSVLGAPCAVPAHTKPVCNGHVPKEQLAEFEAPEDISHLGVIPTMVEHTEHHLAALTSTGLAELVPVRHCDTQGPFDIAAQARGHDELFLDMYVDPDFVHDLMAKSLDIYVKMNLLCKSMAGHPVDSGPANTYWMDPGSVRLCDDSGILISAEMYEQFCADYVRRAYEPFGGGHLHYCGGVPEGGRPEGLHLHEVYCSIDGLRGLNFTTGGDWPVEVKKVMDRRVAYIGGLPRGEDEPLEEYFRRVLSLCPGRKGMILHSSPRPGEQDRFLDTWHAVQDEVL
jgi:hypothetical protein